MVEDGPEIDAIFRALAHRARRDMLVRLARGDLSVSELAEPLTMSLAAASKHVQVLERAGLVRRTIAGRRHVCSLERAALAAAAEWLSLDQRQPTEELAARIREDAPPKPEAAVRLRRTIFATPDRVYRAWLDPHMLLRWFAPGGLAATRAEVGERVGGSYRIWLADDAGKFECEVLELVPDARIVLRWRFVAGGADEVRASESQLTISLRRASGDSTRVTLLHEGLAPLERPEPITVETAEPPETTEHVPREELGEIWRQYKASGDRALRDRLILTYTPLVKYVAGKLGSWLPPHVDGGDLISYGLLGLIGAIERFEPDREIKFETFALPRIRGAMIDELRSLDWVPRSVRNRAREIERSMAELENRHGRAPSDEEIAAELGLSADEYEQALTEIARSALVAVDQPWPGAAGESATSIDAIHDPSATPSADPPLRSETRDALAAAVMRLPDRERLLVTLYYYEELSLREIAEVLGITEARAAQLHASAVLRLRVRFGALLPLVPPEAPERWRPLLPRLTLDAGDTAPPGLAENDDRGWRAALNRLAAALAEE
jgi:RNA polymerase sigma factor FliA